MKKQDGSDLKFFGTVAGQCNVESFGILLLNDENGSEVNALAADNARKGTSTEVFVQSIIKTWLTKGSPDAPCTYEHLIQCLNDSGLGTLAVDLAAAVKGMLYISGLYTLYYASVLCICITALAMASLFSTHFCQLASSKKTVK